MSTLQQSSHSRLTVTAWWIIAAAVSAHLLPFVVQPGMFFDGNMYAAIARNMATGFGNLWQPAFSPGPLDHFYKEPVLAYLLESFAFRVFGDHLWVEKLYSAATSLITIAIVAAIWRRLVPRRSSQAEYSWLPVLFWLIWPRWTWQYENNWMENTMMVFAYFAVYCGLRADENSSQENFSSNHFSSGLKWIVAGALSILAAMLSKGPTGMFPLVTPLIAWAALRRVTLRRALAINTAWAFFFCAAFGLVLLQPAARQCVSEYLHQQLFPSMQGKTGLTLAWGRFYILKTILINLRVPMLVALAILSVDYLRRRFLAQASQPSPLWAESGPSTCAFLFCLLTAASASLPIMLCPKQLTHYAFQSYPFFAMALAFWCAPSLERLFSAAKPIGNKQAHLPIRAVAGATVLAMVCVSAVVAGRPHVDQELLHDALAVGRLLPSGTVVGVSGEFKHEYPFCAYLSRCDNIGVDHFGDEAREYLLASLDEAAPPPADCVSVPTDMAHYRLYRRLEVGTSAGDNGGPSRHVGQTANPTRR